MNSLAYLYAERTPLGSLIKYKNIYEEDEGSSKLFSAPHLMIS